MVGYLRMVRNINDTRYGEFANFFCGGKVMEDTLFDLFGEEISLKENPIGGGQVHYKGGNSNLRAKE